jgi:Uncharacterized protein conserved in bacteria
VNLIVNADDFGLTKGINLGILEGIRRGIVTSCTMVANGAEDAFIQGAQIYHEYQLDVGVHLVLTMGMPLSANVGSLTDDQGDFYKLDKVESMCRGMDPAEIRKEFMAQINKVRQAGIEITHLDSHHHVHMLPVIRDVYLEIAEELGLPVRGFLDDGTGTVTAKGCSPQRLITDFYGTELTESRLCSILADLSEESTEIMCHPAYVDQELMDLSRYSIMRAKELSILCSNRIKEMIRNQDIHLIGYRDFQTD